MKLKLGVLILLLFIVGCGCGNGNGEEVTEEEPAIDRNEEVIVVFEDEILEELIREELEKPEGDITSFDMLDLYFFTINDAGVENLTGLEYALELREFSIQRETVDSLLPLKNLSQLERLSIRYCEIINLPIEFSEEVNLNHVSIVGTIIEDVTFLRYMTNVDHLTMTDAGIEEIAALENLVNVQQLNLRGNDIEDISALANMQSLEVFNIQGNNVQSIDVLSELKALDDLVLSYNPIYNLKPLENLPSLSTLIIYLPHEEKHLIFDQVEMLENQGIRVDYHR